MAAPFFWKRCLPYMAGFFFLLIVPCLIFSVFHPDYLLTSFWLVLLAMPLLILAKNNGGGFWLLVLFISTLLFLLTGLETYDSIMEAPFAQAQFLSFVETNKNEALSYLQTHKMFFVPPLLVLTFVIGSFLFYREKRLGCFPFSLPAVSIFLIVFVLAIPETRTVERIKTLFSKSLVYNLAREKYVADTNVRMASLRAMPVSKKERAKNTRLFIVIGESANRHHLGLYDYVRPTTPRLSALQEQGNLFVFDNVITSYPSTLTSLVLALTDREKGELFKLFDHTFYTLPEIFTAADIKNYWYSAQPEHGICGQTIADLSLASTGRVFVTPDWRDSFWSSLTFASKGIRSKHDGFLLPHVQELLENEKGPMVVFLHLMGSHLSYESRYPSSFAHFSKEPEHNKPLKNKVDWERIDTYDDSILYTDDVLYRLISMIKKSKQPSVLLYFSDHGESPYLGQTHDPSKVHRGDLDVPFILWASSSYQRQNPDLMKRVKMRLSAPFMLNHLFDVAQDLIGIYSPFYKAKNNLLSKDYVPVSRMTMNGELNYETMTESYCPYIVEQTGFNPCRKKK